MILCIIMQQQQDVLLGLVETIKQLINDLRVIFNRSHELDDILSVEIYFKRLHAETVMKEIIENVYPHKENIMGKKIEFFDKHSASIFAGLDDSSVKYYRDEIVDKKRVSIENMNAVWAYLHNIIAYVDVYYDLQEEK